MGRAGYWAKVARRAAKETIGASPWSSRLRVVAAIVAAAVGFGVGWLNTGVPNDAVLWSLAAVAAVIGIAFLLALWWIVPADLAAEAAAEKEALEAHLATYNATTHNVGLNEVVGYICTGQWRTDFWGSEGAELGRVGRVLTEIEEKAHFGQIQVWGAVSMTSRPVEVPQSFWEHGKLDPMALFEGHPHPATNRVRTHEPPGYRELRFNRAQIERERWHRQVVSG